jgi:hypothetical protein
LATLPATIQELHNRGKRLAEQKDRAMAQQQQQQQQQQQAPSSSELTESILNAKAPVPSFQNPIDSSKPQEKDAELPVTREPHVDQSEAGTTAVREEGETERSSLINTASGGASIDESCLHSLK